MEVDIVLVARSTTSGAVDAFVIVFAIAVVSFSCGVRFSQMKKTCDLRWQRRRGLEQA